MTQTVGQSPSKPLHTVLVVEDDEDIREVMIDLLDLMMPVMDGWAFERFC
jgi:CheY-like chemotaxis protein